MNLSNIFNKSYDLWKARKGKNVDKLQEIFPFFIKIVKNEIKKTLYSLGFDGFVVKTSVGKGKWVSIPWISISQPDISPTPQTGIYVVYFISETNEGIFLTLNQGTEHKTINEIRELSYKYRNLIEKPEHFIEGLSRESLNLSRRSRKWSIGTIYSKFYHIDDIKNYDDMESVLLNDLKYIMISYSNFIITNLERYSDIDGINENLLIYENELKELLEEYNNRRFSIETISENIEVFNAEYANFKNMYDLIDDNIEKSFRNFYILYNEITSNYLDNKDINNLNDLINLIENYKNELLVHIDKKNNIIKRISESEIMLKNAEEDMKISLSSQSELEIKISQTEENISELKGIKITIDLKAIQKDKKPDEVAIKDYEEMPFYEVFVAYYRNTAEDFAKHVKNTLEFDGIKTFIDIIDIPKTIKEFTNEWWKYRDNALIKCHKFILIMTSGFHKRKEILTEIRLAYENKKEIFLFKHEDLSYEITINLNDKKINLQNYEMIPFDNKFDLVRKTLKILSI